MSSTISSTITEALNSESVDSRVRHGSEAGSHSGYASYIIGFALSVLLTGVPFWAVMTGTLTRSTTVSMVVAAALLQIVVHLKYFLHLDFSREGKLDTFAFLFTALIIVMVVGLSIWIVYSANALMM